MELFVKIKCQAHMAWTQKAGIWFIVISHDDVIKLKHFPRYCPFVRWIHRPVVGELPSQRPVTRSFDVFFDL